MATKCVVCVHENTELEFAKHPNEVTIAALARAKARHEAVLRNVNLDTLRLCRFHHQYGTAQPKTQAAIAYVNKLRNGGSRNAAA